MMRSELFLNAYLEANVVLIFGFLLWLAVRWLLGRVGLGQAYESHLRIVNHVFIAMALCPLVVLGAGVVRDAGVVTAPMTLSDFAVAQYLNGQIAMPPSEFAALVSFRETLVRDFLVFSGPVSVGLAAFAAAGWLFFAGRLLLNLMRLRRVLRGAYAWRQFGSVHLLLSDRIHVPFSTRGIRRRFVVIPSAMLARPQDLRIVVAHELQHFRQGDVAWEIAMEVLRPFFFWNPAFLLWKRHVERLRELACDQRLVARARVDARAYCECLLTVCRDSLERPTTRNITLPAVAFVQPRREGGFLGLRLLTIASAGNKGRSAVPPGLLALPIMAAVAVLSVAIQAPGDWSQDRLMLSTIVNLERLDARNGFARP